ncbi:hypothetical protein GGQ73_001315 [Rhizobium skierniewicense]|uniref:Uncharacterized protein n=1 Tax=Rhizobium skierniewicense TaxID=984260 RepID=A0A7W6G152_9HYPH|nr:hypothetical protein [Rhizobium skierniewicense]MBB3945382.1 hypothetical protein [Rhizobium skierniewicense]NTF33912.1 hypothetical protein [Rhizobium skierniewicense]
MLSLPAIIGISFGAAGYAAFSRKNKPWSFLKRLGYFIAASLIILLFMLAVNFGLYYMNLQS